MEEFKKELQVNMFGAFSFSVEDEVLLEDEGKSRKLWNLLAYLIANRNRKLSPTDLPDILCNDGRSEDPAKAVKNLVYRLRNLLLDSQLPKLEYISQTGGIYKWNNQIKIKLDVDQFLNLYKEARNPEISSQEAIDKYLEAISLYKGRFLPRLAYEEWTATLRVYYHRIFTNCIKECADLLIEKNNYRPMVEICEKAISLDPYDEDAYIIYLKSLNLLNMDKQALKAYEDITERLYSELGVNPSEKLKQLYREVLKKNKNFETDLVSIKSDLNEEAFMEGTFCTDYEIFKGIYRFLARSVERSGASVYIVLFTVTDKNGEIPELDALTKNMYKLKSAINAVIRKGDAFAKYSVSQYIIILPGTNYENGIRVGERILTTYNKHGINKTISITYKLQPLDPKVLLK